MNLARVLAHGAAEHPERPALLFEGDRISYGELDRRAAVAAATLNAQGVAAGDRVAIRLPNTPDYIAAYFGILRLGAIAVPLNILLAQPEVEMRLHAAKAKTLVDRKKEMIIRRGYNVYPREVEEVLYEHPEVLEAAVVGVPHESLGEDVAAIVVPRPHAALDPDDLKAWVKERVAAYKYPRHVAFVDELPKSPTGKILKRRIDLSPLFGDVVTSAPEVSDTIRG